MIEPSKELPCNLTIGITKALLEHFCIIGLRDTCISPACSAQIWAVIQAVIDDVYRGATSAEKMEAIRTVLLAVQPGKD